MTQRRSKGDTVEIVRSRHIEHHYIRGVLQGGIVDLGGVIRLELEQCFRKRVRSRTTDSPDTVKACRPVAVDNPASSMGT